MAREPAVVVSVEAVIETVKEQLKQNDDRDRDRGESPLWKGKVELLESVPGIGPVSAKTLLSRR